MIFCLKHNIWGLSLHTAQYNGGWGMPLSMRSLRFYTIFFVQLR